MGCRGGLKYFLVQNMESQAEKEGFVCILTTPEWLVFLRLCHPEQQLSWEHGCQRNRHISITSLFFVLLVNVIQYQPSPHTRIKLLVLFWSCLIFLSFFASYFLFFSINVVLQSLQVALSKAKEVMINLMWPCSMVSYVCFDQSVNAAAGYCC